MELFLKKIRSKTHAASYKGSVRFLSNIIPYYIVNEFPKSGGTWLAQMLAEALQIPFYRNEIPKLKTGIVHGHFLHKIGLRYIILMWRDPRDIIISLYYHCYFNNEKNNYLAVELMKKHLSFDDYTDIKYNLPNFIRFIGQRPLIPRFTWTDFALRWAHHPHAVHTSYEALRSDAPRELIRIVNTINGMTLTAKRAEEISENYSFERARARSLATLTSQVEVPFVRAGSVGGWRKYFSPAAQDEFERWFGEAARQVGYPHSERRECQT